MGEQLAFKTKAKVVKELEAEEELLSTYRAMVQSCSIEFA